MGQKELQELQEAMEELRQIRQEFQELVKCKGWDRLHSYGESQLEYRRQQREGMSGSLDKMIESEFINGEVSGIRLFLQFPEILMNDFDEQLQELIEESKDDDRD